MNGSFQVVSYAYMVVESGSTRCTCSDTLYSLHTTHLNIMYNLYRRNVMMYCIITPCEHNQWRMVSTVTDHGQSISEGGGTLSS